MVSFVVSLRPLPESGVGVSSNQTSYLNNFFITEERPHVTTLLSLVSVPLISWLMQAASHYCLPHPSPLCPWITASCWATPHSPCLLLRSGLPYVDFPTGSYSFFHFPCTMVLGKELTFSWISSYVYRHYTFTLVKNCNVFWVLFYLAIWSTVFSISLSSTSLPGTVVGLLKALAPDSLPFSPSQLLPSSS